MGPDQVGKIEGIHAKGRGTEVHLNWLYRPEEASGRRVPPPPPPPPPDVGHGRGWLPKAIAAAIAPPAATAVRQLPIAEGNCMAPCAITRQLSNCDRTRKSLSASRFPSSLAICHLRLLSREPYLCKNFAENMSFSLNFPGGNACCQQKRIIVSLQKTLQDFTVRASRQINHRSE